MAQQNINTTDNLPALRDKLNDNFTELYALGTTPGEDGLSAYEVAVENGFVGTEAAWLDSLVGDPGADGSPGATGPQGETGPTGPAGEGVPTGGSTGQVLAKASATNYDTQWVTPASGGSGGGGGLHIPVVPPSGQYVSSSIMSSPLVSLGFFQPYKAYLSPFYPGRTFTATEMAVRKMAVTSDSLDTDIRFGVYAGDTTTGLPTTLLYESNTITAPASLTGLVIDTGINLTFEQGKTYWLLLQLLETGISWNIGATQNYTTPSFAYDDVNNRFATMYESVTIDHTQALSAAFNSSDWTYPTYTVITVTFFKVS